MSDLRFTDIVINSNEMLGPDGVYHTAVCKTCSTKHKVTTDEFLLSDMYELVSTDDGYKTEPANALNMQSDNYKAVLKYVAEMRSWNCCHEGGEPLDGFPDEPDVHSVDFGQ